MENFSMAELYKTAGICDLPLDPVQAADALGIKVVSYATIAEIYEETTRNLYRYSRFGFSFKENKGLVIAINENSCGERRRRFTLAHELGHCVLGHLDLPKIDGKCEREAERFAADFLAPQVVLHFCGVSSADEIAVCCGISKTAAEVVYRELVEKRRSGYKFLADEQIEIAKVFEDYINRKIYRKCASVNKTTR